MRNAVVLFLVGIVISLSSCRKDFEFQPGSGDLAFSKDTVYLDTVFTDIGSSTYTLKVYNRSDEDIEIPQIRLERGDSRYRITVDGMTGLDEDGDGTGNGRIFNNVELLANDSLYVFIETTANIADANPEDFLYTDKILFDVGANQQDVDLVTLIQDAVFLYPQRDDAGAYETIPLPLVDEEGNQVYTRGFFLEDSELNWTNEKPYVVYGFAAVDVNDVLNIAPGARVHFHANSGLIVANGGHIVADGDYSTPETQDNEIIFEGDRLEPMFSDIPGQWFGIWLTSGSTASVFDHCTIRNGTIGLWVQNNTGTVSITNTQVYDMSNFGIYGQTATISGYNNVVNSAGEVAVACTLGGSYDFTHCTFNNNWSSSRQSALLLNNYGLEGENLDVQVPYDISATFTNCIIFGSNQTELVLDKRTVDDGGWNVNFAKCQIKFNNFNPQFYTDHPQYDFINDASNIIKTGNPEFVDVVANDLSIYETSDARGFGNATAIVNDILNNARVAFNGGYDLGAYQSVPVPD
jgi:hypothetical protein